VKSSREASVGRWPDLLRGAGSATGLLVGVLGRLHPREAALVAKLRHGSTAALAILLDAASWTSVSPNIEQAERQRAAEAAAVLRRAGWGVVMASRGDALPGVWERLGVNRTAYRLAQAEADARDSAGTAGTLGGVA
jgi:hypothetical protein